MRTAEEIVNEGFEGWVIAGQIKKHCQQLINEARKEAIEECAQRARITNPIQEAARLRLGNYAEEYVKNNPQEVDKQSILSLIKELK